MHYPVGFVAVRRPTHGDVCSSDLGDVQIIHTETNRNLFKHNVVEITAIIRQRGFYRNIDGDISAVAGIIAQIDVTQLILQGGAYQRVHRCEGAVVGRIGHHTYDGKEIRIT